MDPPHSSPATASAAPPVVKLAAKVAHELNNPLDAVLRLVCLAQRKARSGDYADVDRHLADAQFGLERMAEILRELMDIGRQTHETARPPQRLPLADLLAQAARSIAAQAEQKHVMVLVENRVPTGGENTACEGTGEAGLHYDLRLSQVLANLLRNALDAAPEGSTVLMKASLDTADHAGALAITIVDAGPGLDPALLPRLFTPFATTKPRGQGHGLGLAISRDLVHSLGGTLTLENGKANGCVARVLLPMP